MTMNKTSMLMSAARFAMLAGMSFAVPATALAQKKPVTNDIEEIVITARKREEVNQRVPVAVTALTTTQLREKAIVNPYDLTRVAPGLNVRGGSGTRESPDYFIRGQGNTFSGNPGVLVYFNDAPLQSGNPNLANVTSNLQIFDMASVQVLKGPQGTLFGKSSTGGAVIFTPQKPKNEWGGYVDLQLGNYDMRELQGAINIPVIKDKLAIRFAFDAVSRDGFTTSQSTGQKQDQRHRESYRLGVNFTPTDWFSNYTLMTHLVAHEVPSGNVLMKFSPTSPLYNTTTVAFPSAANPGGGTGLGISMLLCGFNPTCTATRVGRINALKADINAEQARINAGGSVRQNLTALMDSQNFKVETISNITKLDFGDVPVLGELSIKNVFSAQRVMENNVIREFGVSRFPHGTVINQYDLVGFPQTPAIADSAQKSPFGDNITNEFQVSGVIDGKHNWVVGYFISQGISHVAGRPPIFGTYNNAFTSPLDNLTYLFPTASTYSKRIETGLFGQFTADLSDYILDGLHLTGGLRGSHVSTFQIFSNYNATATGLVPTTFNSSQNFRENAKSYTVTVDYQITNKLLTYISHRKGFKPGGVNGTAASVTIAGAKPTFSAETLKDVEAGLKSDWTLGDVRGRTNIAVYRSWYSDIQRSETLAITGGGVTTQTNNIAAARITGVEIENTFRFTRSLSGYLNYAYTDAKYTRYPGSTANELGVLTANINSPYVGVPESQLTIGARYALPVPEAWGEMAASANYYYQSGMWLDDSALQDSAGLGFQKHWGTLDLRMDWNNIAGSPIDAAIFGRNVTNHTHLVGVGNLLAALGYFQGMYNEPRTYGVQLRMRFGSDAR